MNLPFIILLLSLSLKSSPNNHSWNLSVEETIPIPAPNNEPVIGPPGKKKNGNKPTPAPTAPPIFIPLE